MNDSFFLTDQNISLTEFTLGDFVALRAMAHRLNQHWDKGHRPFYAFQMHPNHPNYSAETSEKVMSFLEKASKERSVEPRSTYRLAVRIGQAKVIGNVTVDMLPFQDGNRTVFGDLGYFIDPKHQNKGYAKQAVFLLLEQYFKYHSLLDITVHPENEASKKLIKTIGGQSIGMQVSSHYVGLGGAEPREMFQVKRVDFDSQLALFKQNRLKIATHLPEIRGRNVFGCEIVRA